MKSALILGGTGFIGTHISNKLITEGYKVTVLSRSNYTNKQYYLNSSCQKITSSIELQDSLLKIQSNWDYDLVINSCGIGDHSNFSEGSYDIIGSHLLGTINIIRLLNRKKLKRYIHIGSSEEYGQIKKPSNEFLREAPLTPYGFAKTASTHFLQMLYRSEKLPALILRPFLVYGENQSEKKLIPYIVDSCLNDKEFNLTDGNQYREFIHINDLVELITNIAKSKSTKINGKIYDVSSGDIYTVMEIVRLIKEIIGKGKPNFGKRKRRKSEIELLCSSSNSLLNDLEWQRKIPIQVGLQRVVNYRRNNF